jgi:DNA-binding IclR family transcriptional regulator
VPRPALSASRAVAIVNFLAARPGESFTLSELVRSLDVNSASLHAILAALEAEGYVARDPTRKTYRLGSSLVAVGQAALDAQPAIRAARTGAQSLAERFGVECLVAITVGLEFVIIDAVGRPESLQFFPRAGERIPIMPPIGILHAGHLPEPELEAWLSRMGPRATEEDKAAYRRSALLAGQRGYDIGLATPTRKQIGAVMAELGSDPESPALHAKLAELIARLGHERHELLEPQEGEMYDVDNITVAVYGPDRAIVAGLALVGFDALLSAAEVLERVRAAVDTAAAITRSTGGRAPLRL